MNFIKFYSIVSLVLFTLIGCNTTPSLQKYIVDGKENNSFISVDLPANIIELKNNEVSEDLKNTLNTIKKINFLALQVTENNKVFFEEENQKVQAILKNSNYKELMRMNTNEGLVRVNYLGEEEAIDEVVIFGSSNEKGFAIVRVLGENMNPAEILKISQDLKIDGNSDQLKLIEGLFKK